MEHLHIPEVQEFAAKTGLFGLWNFPWYAQYLCITNRFDVCIYVLTIYVICMHTYVTLHNLA